jgi:hypothetical protein
LLYIGFPILGLNQSGGLNTGIVGFFDPLSFVLNGKAASQWFVYEHYIQ